MAVPLSNLTASFANSSLTYTAIGMNVTSSGYSADSTLLNLNVNGQSKFSVDVDGFANVAGGILSLDDVAILGNLDITGDIILGGSITSANVSSANIATASVSSANIALANISSVNIASANVTTLRITTANISSANIVSANIVSMSNIAALNVTTFKITSPGSITAYSTANVYLYYTSATSYSSITTTSAGDITFFTGTATPTRRLTISTTGAITAPGINGGIVTTLTPVYVDSTGALGTTTSIKESKTNIATISSTDWLLKLNPVQYNRRIKNEDGKYTNEHYKQLEYGLIAEEAEPINKEICLYDSNNKLTSVAYHQLITPLLKLVQEQQSNINSLLQRIKILENKK